MKRLAIALCAILAAVPAAGQVCPHTVTLQSASCPVGLNCQTTPGATLITTTQFDQAMLNIAYLCDNADAPVGAGVTSVALTVPAWLSVAGSPITTTGTLAVTAATGQTSGRVIGTCGAATSFGVCALTAGDLPALSALSGAVTDAQVPDSITVTTAQSGDSATAFFSAGTIEAARLPDLSGLNGAVTDAQVPNTVTITSTASKCARFDGSGNLVAATGDCASGDTTGAGSSAWTTVKKTTDESRASTTTLANDGALTIAMTSGVTYVVRGFIAYTTVAAADLKYEFVGPTGTVWYHQRTFPPGGAAFGFGSAGMQSAFPVNQTVLGGSGLGMVEFTLMIAATSTTSLTFQWAQNFSDPTNTTVFAGSYIEWMSL